MKAYGNALIQYFKDSFQELHRVTWPTKNQAIRLSAIVLIFTLVFAFVIGFIDYGFSYVNELILNKI